jgi:hypothetical protein
VEQGPGPIDIPTSSIFPLPMLSPIERALSGLFKIPMGESRAKAPFLYGPRTLARLIDKLQPDLVHSMEFQHCGYNVLEASSLTKKEFPPWLATNWGSDIYYYRNQPGHLEQIKRLLHNADYYSCECQRDVALAEELGFTGKVLPVLTNTGGFDIQRCEKMREQTRTSQRKYIMVKGYQHFAGRALTALDALERCGDLLKGYNILVYSASQAVSERIEQIRQSGRLEFQELTYRDHNQMLSLFAKARIYIGISISDAISTSLLEAMAMGTFPIQTDTSCCDEWIEDGRSGFSVPADDVETIAARISRALENDDLVDNAADLNWDVVKSRLDVVEMRHRAADFYQRVFPKPLTLDTGSAARPK